MARQHLGHAEYYTIEDSHHTGIKWVGDPKDPRVWCHDEESYAEMVRTRLQDVEGYADLYITTVPA